MENPRPVRAIRLEISYDGTDFGGWQRQTNATTIQGEIESRLKVMTGEEIFLHGAGRTDAGVHADAMIAHFHSRCSISCQALLRGLNSMLPPAIRIHSALEVDINFHARFSATGKIYSYFIYTGTIQPPLQRHSILHVNHPVEIDKVRSCLQIIKGTHDFSSFENSGTRDKQAETGRGAVRTLFEAELLEHSGQILELRFVGDGFLRNMVRNLVGTLLEAGRGKIDIGQYRSILLAKDRAAAGPTAPAHGLHLKKVLYDEIRLKEYIHSSGSSEIISFSSMLSDEQEVTGASRAMKDKPQNHHKLT